MNSDYFGVAEETELIGPISRKKTDCARPKNKWEDFKSGICVGNDDGFKLCKNLKVEENSERVKAVETTSRVWPWIKVWRSRKKIAEGRRNTIGWAGNEDVRQFVYWKLKICRGIKMARTIKSIGSKSRLRNNNEYQKAILMRYVEVEMTL